MFDYVRWLQTSVNVTINGIHFVSPAGESDFDILDADRICGHEVDRDDPGSHVVPMLILNYLDSLNNGGDNALAIGEHAFRAGWAASEKTWENAGKVLRSENSDISWNVDDAWSEYDPPEDIKALT